MHLGTQCVRLGPEDATVMLVKDREDKLQRQFYFDAVLDGATSQAEAYEASGVDGLVDQVLRGCNATVFAYGQTGSGKTYTMEGYQYRTPEGKTAPRPDFETDPDRLGITPRAVQRLFAAMEAQHGTGFTVKCSHVQIYMEQVYDLLNPDTMKNGKRAMKFNKLPTKRGDVSGLKLRWSKASDFHLEGLTQHVCTTPRDVMAHFQKGVRNKVMATHKMNMSSSRSHSLFTLEVEAPNPVVPGETVKSKFTLVDLAGSERMSLTGASSGQIMQESIFINKSLFTLRKVISALADQDGRPAHIPYRDSKLTSLLKHSLGGSAFTVMIACLNPCDEYFEENLSSLEYASRAKQITNHIIVNEDPKTRMIRELQEQVAFLKAQLVADGKGMYTVQLSPPPGGAPAAGVAPPARTPPPFGATPRGEPAGTGGGSASMQHKLDMENLETSAKDFIANLAETNSKLADDFQQAQSSVVELSNANEALMLENADLREQVSLIQAVVTMEDGEENLGGDGKAREMHTANTAALMELLELRRENESLREQVHTLEAGKFQGRKKVSSAVKKLNNLRKKNRAAAAAPAGFGSPVKTGKLSVNQLKNVFGQAKENHGGSLGTTLRLSTTGKLLPGALAKTAVLRTAAQDPAEGPPGRGAGRLAEAEEEDPIAHLNRLMETRNALMRQALH